MNSFFSPINNNNAAQPAGMLVGGIKSNKTRKIKGVAVLKLKKFGRELDHGTLIINSKKVEIVKTPNKPSYYERVDMLTPKKNKEKIIIRNYLILNYLKN